MVLAFGAMASAALAVATYTLTSTRTVVREREATGPPCFRLANGQPSPGCTRLVRLLADTCDTQPRQCARVVATVVARVQPEVRRQVAAAVDRALRAPVPRRTSTGTTTAPKREGARITPGDHGTPERASTTPASTTPAPAATEPSKAPPSSTQLAQPQQTQQPSKAPASTTPRCARWSRLRPCSPA